MQQRTPYLPLTAAAALLAGLALAPAAVAAPADTHFHGSPHSPQRII